MSKKCHNCEDNSYTRCNPPVSTNCTFYQGESKECSTDTTFTICKGENMTSVQETIFDKICQILGDIDVSEVVVPECLQDAWDNNDLTILNLFNLALQATCDIQSQVDTLAGQLDTVNPIVDVSLCCCEPDCNSSAQLRLSDALQGIITCVCNARAEAAAAKAEAEAAMTKATAVYDRVFDPTTGLITQFATLNATTIALQVKVAQIDAKTYCLPDC